MVLLLDGRPTPPATAAPAPTSGGGAKLGAELALELVADKWFVLVMHRLRGGPMRYGALKRSLPGVSQRMLTLTLRNMERDGLVTRTVESVAPPATRYGLTPLGVTLLGPLRELCLWAEEHMPEILANRSRSAADGGVP
jgi:DNA-binding HxlR family transcriptional regulator